MIIKLALVNKENLLKMKDMLEKSDRTISEVSKALVTIDKAMGNNLYSRESNSSSAMSFRGLNDIHKGLNHSADSKASVAQDDLRENAISNGLYNPEINTAAFQKRSLDLPEGHGNVVIPENMSAQINSWQANNQQDINEAQSLSAEPAPSGPKMG